MSLHDVIATYPSPVGLKESLLEHLQSVLRTTLPDEPLGIKLSSSRILRPDVGGEDLIDALKNVNEDFLAAIKEGKNGENFLRAYAEFVEEWCQAELDENLVSLFSPVSSACKSD
jgi:U3 small nucleolar RNA-associated protein 6